MSNWKSHFQSLFKSSNTSLDHPVGNSMIMRTEVENALKHTNSHKAQGIKATFLKKPQLPDILTHILPSWLHQIIIIIIIVSFTANIDNET